MCTSISAIMASSVACESQTPQTNHFVKKPLESERSNEILFFVDSFIYPLYWKQNDGHFDCKIYYNILLNSSMPSVYT